MFEHSFLNHFTNRFYCFYSANVKGVVHRDVKPGNFLFSRKSREGYLIDFNLAMVSKSPFSYQYFCTNRYQLLFHIK